MTEGSRIRRGNRAAQAEERQIMKKSVEIGGPGVKGRVRLCNVKQDGSASATEWIGRNRGQRDEERMGGFCQT
jgi:hypothetical protein